MIPFDGLFAQNYVYPLALGAYDATQPPPNFVAGRNAFEIVADLQGAEYTELLKIASPQHRKMMQGMLAQQRKPQLTDPANATNAKLLTATRSVAANLHFGWICIDEDKDLLIVAFRGTEFFHDWLDDADFIPAPYGPIPGRGTVHEGFQLVYYSVRDSVLQTVGKQKGNCTQILITGHSLGGALAALAAPDLLNNAAENLSPTVYTWAEPRVGHEDYVSFFNTHVNVCYRIVNLWDVVPHLPPDLAGYQHEGGELPIDSGFSLDVVKNHVLVSGYLPGIQRWNHDHPVQQTRHLGKRTLTVLVGRTA